MSDLSRTTPVTTASTATAARNADARCRGIGTAPDLAGAARSSNLADTPTAPTAAREALRLAVTDAATREARERIVDLRHGGMADAVAASEAPVAGPVADPVDAPSLELVRLLAHLRSTVTRYVSERRAAGVPVERVIPEVKGLVRAAVSCEGWFDPADTLMAQVVRWAITAYYGQPELAHVPRVD